VFLEALRKIELAEGVRGPSIRERLGLLALLNSLVLQYWLRPLVKKHVSFFIFYGLPIPRLAEGDPRLEALAARACALTCTSSEFASLWRDFSGADWHSQSGATDPEERARLRAELDGLVAHLYGLTEEEFAHVLSTFPVVPQETKDAALAAYRELAPKTADPELAPLLLGGEGPRVEFKSTLRWDRKEKRKNPDLERAVLKTVAGFLNANGGTLLLGVGDDGSPVGLEGDYGTLQKANRDGFALHLSSLLLDRLGKDLAPCLKLAFHRLEDQDVGRLEVSPSSRPVFLTEAGAETFYLRAGNSTRPLAVSEVLAYEKRRWGSAPGG
jgi:hypothetical protein